MSHCLGHKLKHLTPIRTDEHNTYLNCLQFLLEILFNLHPFFIVPPQFTGGNLMGKVMKQKILAYTKIIQHSRSDIQLQY